MRLGWAHADVALSAKIAGLPVNEVSFINHGKAGLDFGLVCWQVAFQSLLSLASGLGILLHSMTWTFRSLYTLEAVYCQLGSLPGLDAAGLVPG
ncbi:hypothetical protein Nepgr_021025 [Nepenthes gracilis]|uniref:Uncharacterized protein n=1 Tax=Nepenthes gracilis TaxID=150966 RepID=A0AAD3XWP2_NEPGR|nr:hypothetical protein Nepgr_021025 [Nepenthes gracilis]